MVDEMRLFKFLHGTTDAYRGGLTPYIIYTMMADLKTFLVYCMI